MAGKGGGAWKVAYADFVTAMMAFFLVMWLVSQDQKVKESIAHYFQGPIGVNVLGDSSRHKQSGGLFYSEINGSVPNQNHRTAGRSVGLLKQHHDDEDPTMVAAEWILEEPNRYEQWYQAAKEELLAARKLPSVQDGSEDPEISARRMLAHRMKRETLVTAKHNVSDPMLLDMIETTISQIDWEGIADECIERTQGR